jgi:DNA-binding transcriptional regulator YiaG
MKRRFTQRMKRTRPRRLNLPADLRAWRRARALSQSKAALKLQISIRTLQEWEQGRAAPRGIALIALQKLIIR